MINQILASPTYLQTGCSIAVAANTEDIKLYAYGPAATEQPEDDHAICGPKQTQEGFAWVTTQPYHAVLQN